MRNKALIILVSSVALIAWVKVRESKSPELSPEPALEFVPSEPTRPDQQVDATPPPSAAETPLTTPATAEEWKVVPPEPEVVRRQYDASQPLTRDLIFVQACAVRVTRGSLHVPVGVRARLVQDQGDSAEVKVGGTTVNVPRMAVASVSSERVTVVDRPAAVIAGVSGFFERIFSPLPNSLGIDVKEIGTGKGIDRKWQSEWGSYERDFYGTKGLQVDVRNVSRSGSGNCQTEVYWFGRQLKDKKLIIHHREAIPMEVAPITSVSRRFWSPLAASSVDKYVLAGVTNKAGANLEGWAVVVTRDGKILAARGSGPEQEAIAHSEAQLGNLMASYRPTGRQATEGMPTWRTDQARTEWDPGRLGNDANGWQNQRRP